MVLKEYRNRFYLIFFLGLCFLIFENRSVVFAQDSGQEESEQQINDFSLAGYGDKGKKTWDLSGKSADVFTDIVKLKDVIGNLYNKEEKINLSADQGDFNKREGLIHLEKDVIVTTSSGAKLTTDSLDWDRKKNIVSTPEIVNIEKDNMITIAKGAVGEPGLNKVKLQKDVEVKINPQTTGGDLEKDPGKEKIVVTCDGPLSIDYASNTAVFNNNVKVVKEDSEIYSDIMEIYFNRNKTENSGESAGLMNSEVDKIIARNNVRIVRGENVSYSDAAVYSALSKKITLTGNPKLVIYSSEEINAPIGD